MCLIGCRFSIAFPMICGHFMTAVHDLCPDERMSIGQTSVQYCNWFLKEMSDEVPSSFSCHWLIYEHMV